MNIKRIGAGEYTYNGWAISLDEYDGTWWASKNGVKEDFETYRDAKDWIYHIEAEQLAP